MADSMPDRRSAIHSKSFAPVPAKAAIARKSPAESDGSATDADASSLLLDVCDAFGLSPKQACDLLGYDRSKYTRLRTHEARATLDDAMKLPAPMYLALRDRMDAAKGVAAGREEEVFADQVGQLLTAILRHRLARRRSEVA